MYTYSSSLLFKQGDIPPEAEGEEPSPKKIRTDYISYGSWCYGNTIDLQRAEGVSCSYSIYQEFNGTERIITNVGNPTSYTPYYDTDYKKQYPRFRIKAWRANNDDFSPEDLAVHQMTAIMASLWEVKNDRLTHAELARRITGPYIQRPYPPHIWYVEYNRLTHTYLPAPADVSPDIPIEYDDPYIHVYDISEPQDGFDHNGLAVLDPTECVSNKEFNGRWDITLKHPMDKFDKWHWLIGQNVLKVKGQLFRIDEVTNAVEGGQIYVDVHAKHISYDLADVWIEYSGIGTYNKDTHQIVRTGKQVLDQLISDRIPDTEYTGYTFELHSDISILEGELSLEIRDQSFIAALIGSDNCFANRIGGELYRDNFFLSMNSQMQNSRQEAFALRYSADMIKIKQKIDFSEWVTYLRTVDNQGDSWAISYTGTEWAIHHHKQKRVHFNYSDSFNSMNNLNCDGNAYWNTVSTPKVTYEVKIASIKGDPKYKEFLELQNYEVGDTGYVYCEPLQISTLQRVMAIKRNELTDEIMSITLGNMQNSILRPSYMGNTISSGNSINDKQLAAVQEQVDELSFAAIVNTPIATIDDDFLVTEDGEYILYSIP